MLGAAIDRAGADLVLHGHAHRGSPAGTTPGGIPVRNVAQPVIRQPYAVFTIEREDEELPEPEGDEAATGGRDRMGRRPRWMRRAARLARRGEAPDADNGE